VCVCVFLSFFFCMSFYAVRKGRIPGIYLTWTEASKQVIEFSGAEYKKFKTKNEADEYYLYGHVNKSIPIIDCTSLPPIVKPSNMVVYTDGSCHGNGSKDARGGIGVYWGPDNPLNLAERLEGQPQTNQRAELTAAIRALEQAAKIPAPLEIRSDSEYTINCASVWINGWKKNGWKTAKGTPVKNDDLIRKLNALITARKFPVTWTHVYGHKGEPGNEAADKLAEAGSQK
jgi:ribonuclease HI